MPSFSPLPDILPFLPALPCLPPAGFTFCNNPDLRFTQGEKVRFHIMALGTEGECGCDGWVGDCCPSHHGPRHRGSVSTCLLLAAAAIAGAASTASALSCSRAHCTLVPKWICPQTFLSDLPVPCHLPSPPAVDLHTPNFVGESLQMDGQTMPATG
jgi:hypothetical protein